MNNISRALVIVLISVFVTSQVFAEEYRYENGKKQGSGLKETAAGCAPASAYDWLDINNVRARINTGGDMWWDLPGGTGAKYFIPKAGSATSMFSGALWIGGLDINNQLKLAAQRYRQVGIDYWTGPLTVDGTAATDEATCAQYDRFAKITRAVVDDFLAHTDPETGFFVPSEDYEIPPEILEWPAHGDVSKNQSYYLAPFYDNDGDGEYDPFAGDYPYYDIENVLCHTDIPTMEEELEGTITGSILADQVIKGDQTLWWVFNDKGDVHTETNGAAIGMEIRAQAFAFATNDVINNMTFYSYEIINRSTFVLTQTFFSPWVDTDLGYARDDFVGCDVARGLGYCYNGTAVDGSGDPESYGGPQPPPPAIGVDFFQGPYMDPDGLDNPKYEMVIDAASGDTSYVQLCDVSINGVNFGNDIVDDERYGMRRFVYHNNSGGNQGDPQIAPQYYNYLKGVWKDNTKMMYGGTAHVSGSGTVGPECDFMFPGDTDPCNWGTGGVPPNGGYTQNGLYWTEETGNNGAPNPPEDRRFMQSAGPFTLRPGAVNYITVGIPWARATAGTPFSSVELLRTVDDKCQALFDNCFKVIDGPSAPDLAIQELDKELIVYISNSPSSNNYQEKYVEFDPNIYQPLPGGENGERSDSLYRFEGYQIFQLKDLSVGVESLHNPDLARLVAQFDIKNGVGKLVNYYKDDLLNANVPVLEVDGADDGIAHSFELTQDAFATGDVRLVNNRRYYYMALAYAYNEYLPYSPDPDGWLGQKIPYLSGRKNIKTYTAMPHLTINGTVINGDYGESPEITRIAGNGNGCAELELTDETIEEILSKPPAGPDNLFGSPDYPIAYNPVYKENSGPLNVKIIDPLNVVSTTYTWWMDTLKHVLIPNATGNLSIEGDTTSKYVGRWFLKDNTTGKVYETDTTIIVEDEVLFPELGISINVVQPFAPGPIPIGTVDLGNGPLVVKDVLARNNGIINAEVEYADSSQRWLSGVSDEDIPGYSLDWIRSGIYKSDQAAQFNDWRMGSAPDTPWDPDEVYEKLIDGTWAPYSMAAYGNRFIGLIQSPVGPAYDDRSKLSSKLKDIASVDIVFTPDKSKWTRSVVLEMSFDPLLSEGNAQKFELRKAPSVDKDGNYATIGEGPSDNPNDPNYISDHGMGWFPGYAINIETGERLNIMYGEDSYLAAENGRDMLFNPPPRNLDLDHQYQDPNIIKDTLSFTPVLGGKHYIYIMNHNTLKYSISGLSFQFNSPAYDAGRYNVSVLDTIFEQPITVLTTFFFAHTMYVGVPMGVKGEDWLSNEAKVKIRVCKPYERGYAQVPLDTVYPGMDINNYYPMYQFSMEGVATQFSDPQKTESDLDEINIVPNPYYAYSAYENNPLDNRIKITNLPEKCTVTIYNVSGTKIKQFKKDTPETTIEWDLKNFASVPISGGVYYIHIKSDQGERVLKWFSIMRVPDLNTF